VIGCADLTDCTDETGSADFTGRPGRVVPIAQAVNPARQSPVRSFEGDLTDGPIYSGRLPNRAVPTRTMRMFSLRSHAVLKYGE